MFFIFFIVVVIAILTDSNNLYFNKIIFQLNNVRIYSLILHFYSFFI